MVYSFLKIFNSVFAIFQYVRYTHGKERMVGAVTFGQLQYLLEVSRTGSVTQAAKNLFVSSSSVSIAVGNLEKELGYPLFVRTQKGLVPTDRGRKVLEYAGRICQTYKLLSEVDQETRRTVRINGGDHSFISNAFARLVEENRDNGDVRMTMTGYEADELYQKLLHNELDLSLLMVKNYVFGTWEKRLKKGGLECRVLRTLPAVVQVGPGHRLYEAKRVYPHDLKNEVLIDDPHHPATKNNQFNSIIYTDQNKTLFASGHHARSQLVARGLGYCIGLMPPKDAPQDPAVRRIPLEGIHYYLLAATNPQNPTPPEIDRYLELLEEELALAYPNG